MNHGLKTYIVFWLSQSLSQLGSAMTGFTLILWAYEQNGSAMTVSLMSFFNYVPYIIASIFAGTFVDSHSKKKIMLASDSIAALCSTAVFSLSMSGGLQIWNIYLVNFITGFMNAFQGPASAVAIGRIVPKDRIKQVSGMNAFSGSLVTVLAPVLAASLYAFGGLPLVIIIDLASFVFAFAVLAFVIKIPEEKEKKKGRTSMLSGTREGLVYLRSNQGILMIILTMALLNFFSRLTYENILSPMILARSGNNHEILGVVNAAMGVGGIVGGLVVSSGKVKGNSVRMIYVSAMLSFLLGDVMMGLGRTAIVWSIAAVAASLPIAFINAGQMDLLYRHVPGEIQGRVFAVRNALQFGTIPVGILMGGFLADYVLEPLMRTDLAPVKVLQQLAGTGAGSGMAVMFLCTGVTGALFSLISYQNKEIRKL
ncbi:MFS transporter [Enterocloster sp. OA13]|uniref:MFS transporter n=1 Tax=Enterocloster sp. OA13 TaxID=2914161 RepID=UPI0004B7956E|nr:MFS transporter [Enterocloster sp. OA13]